MADSPRPGFATLELLWYRQTGRPLGIAQLTSHTIAKTSSQEFVLDRLDWRGRDDQWRMGLEGEPPTFCTRVAPVVNPEKLRAIRCAFQLIAHGTSSDRECDKLLVSFLGEGYGEWLPRGWYGCGRRRDVPKDAFYTGHFGDQYVWVCSGHVESLTLLTIVPLNIATLDANEPPAKTVYTCNYDGDKLKSMEVTSQPETSGKSASGPADIKVRRDFYNPLQSQIQMKGR